MRSSLHAITVALAIAAASAGAVAATAVAPFTSASDAAPASESEQRVWGAGEELDEVVAKAGLVYPDAALAGYVQGVADRLFPEFRGRFTARVVKGPYLNAFTAPNGSVYVSLGLLTRFENEAQLATVLSHEGTHFTNRHGFVGMKSVKDNSAFAVFGTMLGVPILPQLLAASSIFGYSRELENEADTVGYRRLVQAGYDGREAPRTFQHLMQEVQTEGIKEPFFFSTHPKLKDRFDNMTKLSASVPGGTEGTSRSAYARTVERARIDNIETLLSMSRVKYALALLQDPNMLGDLPAHAPYYVGEAYRLRNESGDLQRAEASYRQAIQAAPGFAPSYRAMALLQLKSNNYDDAETNLRRYLEIAPNAVDRKYAENYLRMIDKKRERKP